MSFAQLTNRAILYGDEEPPVFCLYIIRDYTLAILGAKGSDLRGYFGEFEIEDLRDYLKMTFLTDERTDKFYRVVKKNWL